MAKSVDYKAWAEKFAAITDEFIWLHSGSSNGGDLNIVFRDALNAMVTYRKETANTKQVPLKQSIQDAHEIAVLNGLDPWTLILKTIAIRADDWCKHISEDNEVTDDIRAWLNHESKLDQ